MLAKFDLCLLLAVLAAESQGFRHRQVNKAEQTQGSDVPVVDVPEPDIEKLQASLASSVLQTGEVAISASEVLEVATSSWRQVRVQPGFGGCHGLIPWSDDTVLLADTYRGSKAVYSVNVDSGVMSLYFQSYNLSQPAGMAFSPDKSYVYVCDVGTRNIHMHRTGDKGQQVRLRPNGAPWNARYSFSNELYYVTFQGQVRRYGAQGDVQIGGTVPNAYDLVLLSNGDIIATSMSGSLYRIKPSGATSQFASFPSGSVPEGMDVFVDRYGREQLVVADTQLGKIYQVDPSNGAFSTIYDGGSQGFRTPINVRTLGRRVFVNALDGPGNMLLLVGDLS